ncbi:MAG TPA: adenylate cyclase regulatory domain-containing protein [Acidimicrobiia bacterium]|nr:adenylate cyclase regulatory domain-containing protein [Acidimicrobiia bacterium]
MTDTDAVDDFVAAGLYDPDSPNAAAQLELLEYLTDEVGASIPEIVMATESGGLMSFAAFRRLREGREHLTIAEAAAQAGIDLDVAIEIWRAAGLSEPRPFERRCGGHDVEMFRVFLNVAGLVERDLVIQLVRTIGEAVARIADAEIALLRSNVEAPLVQTQQFVDVARAYVAVADAIFPRLAEAIDTLHRHHLQMIGRRYSDVGAPTSAHNVVQLAVGFADLAGYTGLTQELDAHGLAHMLSTFEATTGDVITRAGATVAKRIGDAVMYVSNAPGVACGLAVELLEACAARGLPKLRVAVAFGDVMVRQGDFYGPVVNLAARLVAAADPGTALADAALFDRLGSARMGYAFLPAGWLELAGYTAPVPAYQLLRT